MRGAKQISAALALMAVCFSYSTRAADTSNSQTKTFSNRNTGKEPSQEARKQMADAHKKMADCLNSNRSMQECRNEMRANSRSKHDHDRHGCCGDHHGMMGNHDNDHDD